MNKLHILVCGGRHFTNYTLLCDILDNVIGDIKEVEIVSGHCQGADMLGEKYAQEHEIDVKIFPADWEKYGRKAGPIRNKQMVDYITSFDNRIVVAFTNENTIGTRNTITLAKKANISVVEIPYAPSFANNGVLKKIKKRK